MPFLCLLVEVASVQTLEFMYGGSILGGSEGQRGGGVIGACECGHDDTESSWLDVLRFMLMVAASR